MAFGKDENGVQGCPKCGDEIVVVQDERHTYRVADICEGDSFDIVCEDGNGWGVLETRYECVHGRHQFETAKEVLADV